MKEIERLAIKYLLIGVGIGILNYLVAISHIYLFEFFDQIDLQVLTRTTSNILKYSSNIIVGLFILFDSVKYTKNKLLISLTGFLMPVFGICFLIMEQYLIQNTSNNG